LDQVIDTPAQLARMIILRSRNEFMRLKHEKIGKENNPENTNTTRKISVTRAEKHTKITFEKP